MHCSSSSSLLSSFSSLSLPTTQKPQISHKFPSPLFNFPCLTALPTNCSTICPRYHSSLHCAASLETLETSECEAHFVEIGYISSVHGLDGEVRVKSSTGFPELRFSEPGRRWLRKKHLGRETIREVELLEGRGHSGQMSWIVKFNGVQKVEEAQLLVGSTILVSKEDRPELEVGEFYTQDLVGMSVVLKETAEPVGTVVRVFNSAAHDLLHVMLTSFSDTSDGSDSLNSDANHSAHLVWIPFVEAIVPTVDVNKREMLITPPKGLLELNLRTDERSKKERRQIEWKERQKYQRRLIAAKKNLSELDQKHVFHGFRHGGKDQGSVLADQIVAVNSKLLQKALQDVVTPSERWNLCEFIDTNFPKQVRNKVPGENPTTAGVESQRERSNLLENRRVLTSKGKVATVLVVDESGIAKDASRVSVHKILSGGGLEKIEDRQSMPLILVCNSNAITPLRNLFSDNDHFAFHATKVWILEEEKLPVVSSCLGENDKHKILMKSPWEILKTPVGSGGVISLLSSDNILENLCQMGVEYIEVCSVNGKYTDGQSLVGLVNPHEADIWVKLFQDIDDNNEHFQMIFSMTFMRHLIKQYNKIQFYPILKASQHVEMVDKEWVDVVPSSPNSYELRCSIYSALRACPSDKIFVLGDTE